MLANALNVPALILTGTNANAEPAEAHRHSFTFWPPPMVVSSLSTLPHVPTKYILQPWQLVLVIFAGLISRQEQ
ncbi:MAG: hypothetical protein GY880_29315 [Planctomycetaceae bacterium]|nr:hypothetical protein [Planctomycetaceae bacterium]